MIISFDITATDSDFIQTNKILTALLQISPNNRSWQRLLCTENCYFPCQKQNIKEQSESDNIRDKRCRYNEVKNG